LSFSKKKNALELPQSKIKPQKGFHWDVIYRRQQEKALERSAVSNRASFGKARHHERWAKALSSIFEILFLLDQLGLDNCASVLVDFLMGRICEI